MTRKELTDKKIWIAPLAGYTDLAYRTILKDWGADVLVSEMISVDGLLYNTEKSLEYAQFNEKQRPFGIQLFGSDPLIFAKALEKILPLEPDFIDINMGCPVKKVVNRGVGSALMKTPEIAFQIVQTVKKELPKSIPLSVKIRSGWDFNSQNFLSFGQQMEEAGADILILHPRTRSQQFSGKSNWQQIGELKQKVQIPVIGNGDITCEEEAQQMYMQTACDSIMIGRGILGKPWLIKQIKHFLLTGIVKKISYPEKLESIMKHYKMVISSKNEEIGIKEMRSHLAFYTKGLKGGSQVRKFINENDNFDAIMNILSELFYGQIR
jgi:tRNA-dihydrouridine synthase B